MKAKEIRELSDDQIRAELNALERKVFALRTQAETEKLKAPSEMTNARKDIARLKTVLCQREQAGVAEQGAGV